MSARVRLPVVDATAPLLCPSGQMKVGATVLGVVTETGEIAYLDEKVVVDEKFIAAASAGRDPLKRFRFSHDCMGHGCGQWDGDHCSVSREAVKHLVAEDAGRPTAAELPRCHIRARCRWFAERGAAACRACPEVITSPVPAADGA